MTRVKICGITNLGDALDAAQAGADAIGFVFASSPRQIGPDAAARIVESLPPLVSAVGVFVDADPEEIDRVAEFANLDAVQLHGDESPELCARLRSKVIKRFSVREGDRAEDVRARIAGYDVAAWMLDPGAGSGRIFDWRIARGLAPNLFVSGGLNPENVAEAIRIARPFGVDVSSGVERSIGRKDAAKVREFIRQARSADGV